MRKVSGWNAADREKPTVLGQSRTLVLVKANDLSGSCILTLLDSLGVGQKVRIDGSKKRLLWNFSWGSLKHQARQGVTDETLLTPRLVIPR